MTSSNKTSLSNRGTVATGVLLRARATRCPVWQQSWTQAALGWLGKTLFPSSSCAFHMFWGRGRKRKGQESQPENSLRRMSSLYFYVTLSEAMAAVGLGHLPQDPRSPHFLIPSPATLIGAAAICVGRKALGWSGSFSWRTKKCDSLFPCTLLHDSDTALPAYAFGWH